MMKKIILPIFLAISLVGFTQEKFKPTIKQGTRLNYTVNTGEQDVSLLISMDSVTTDVVKMGWNIEGFGSGTWSMRKKSLESANRWWWSEPVLGDNETNDQLVLLLSKAQWNAIQKDKTAEADMQNYSVKEATPDQQFKLNGKLVDAIFLQGQNGTSRIWILNDPLMPLLLKIQGNTMGPDLELKSIE